MLVCAVVLPRRLEEKFGGAGGVWWGGSVAEERERESKSRIQETLFKKIFVQKSYLPLWNRRMQILPHISKDN